MVVSGPTSNVHIASKCLIGGGFGKLAHSLKVDDSTVLLSPLQAHKGGNETSNPQFCGCKLWTEVPQACSEKAVQVILSQNSEIYVPMFEIFHIFHRILKGKFAPRLHKLWRWKAWQSVFHRIPARSLSLTLSMPQYLFPLSMKTLFPFSSTVKRHHFRIIFLCASVLHCNWLFSLRHMRSLD